MGRKKPTSREEDGVAAGGGKSKKKGFQIDDDEYSVGTELSEEATFQKEMVEPVANKKKGKKGGSKKMQIKDGDEEFEDNKIEEDDDDDDALAVKFTGKKKGKGKKGVFTASSFGLLGEEDNDDDNDGGQKDEEENIEDVIEFKGKKPSKSKKGGSGSVFSSSAFDALSDDEDEDSGVVDDNEEAPVISFSGKKKPSKSKKSGGVSTADFDVLEGEEEDNDKDDLDEDMISIKFSGKKKSSKKKKSSALEDGNNNESSEVVDPEQDVINNKTNEPVAETSSKNKKKKKKGGKAGQEEDDLDKILAEIGGTAPIPLPIVEAVQNQLAIDEAAGEKEAEVAEESVTSKKKKKKKDKEKEKKAASAGPSMEEKQDEMKTDVKSKVLDKKVPKAVREMQERLAKLKEAEEKKKREEEERIRKEEEERLHLEELERQEAEKKRLKKEREKEKLLKKKQEGKLLTGKQKEEAKRLEAFRNQLLANAGGLQLNAGDSSKPATKKPLYQKKKPKLQAQSNGAAPAEVEDTDSKAEAENVEEVESSSGRDKSEVTDEVEENGIEEVKEEEDDDNDDADDDEEWDAKSWDEADLKLPGRSAFSDEEVESEPEPLVKELKTTKTATQDVHPRSDAESADISVKKATVNRDNNNKKEIIAKGDMTKNIESVQDLRSPICCIMGHVDTGKTKLLDCIRGTDVQGGEAGGITQQIGATYFPAQNIRDRTKELKHDAKLNVPGLLVIDTPGHESFTNLRSRGSGLCDIAILVVDIMHGLEPQTIESLNLLKMRNTEFIVALNKVDRLYGWKTCKNAPIMKAMKQQTKDVQNEFNQRLIHVITQFKEQGLNTELYYKNKEMGETFSIVPTSAISGEGIPDLLLLLVQWTQKTMIERLTFSNEVQCTVLEVKVIEGHGTTIDVVLVNGVLHEGDQIVVCGLQGPIVTSIRALLTPHPMKELRVKGTYLHHKEIKAAQGIKITAQGLEHAIAGTSLYVVGPDDDLEDIKDSTMEDMKSVMSRIDKSGVGVYVQASTLGSLEALLEFLKSPAVSIPVSAISIGPVHKKDVMKASVMLEKNKEYATILAFDVKVTPEARELADELGVKIFTADIIYHLFDQFKAYIDNIKEAKKKEASDEAVFPCVLKIMPNCVFNKKDPIVLGVDVLEGTAKIGTPICVPQREFTEIGRIASIENNHKPVDFAKKGQKVAIKIIGSNPDEQQKMFGRHFEMEDELVSKITRSSLDALKEHYAEEISKDEKALLFKLKKLFKIP